MFWWTSTTLQHRLNRRFRIKASVHWMYYVPERLFELISETLQHRLNRRPTEHAPMHLRKPGYCVRTPTATIWTQRDQLNRRLKSDTHRFFRCSRFFLQWTSNGYVTSSTLYKGTPWLISVAFDTLKTWGHPWEEEKELWAIEKRSSALFVLQPWIIHSLQV